MQRCVRRPIIVAVLPLLMLAGCDKKKSDPSNLKTAIDSYYSQVPECLWPHPVRFPVQVENDDSSKTAPYDALFDQHLLTRTPVEKKELLIFNKPATAYDLSDAGRSAWTADQSQPGYGNFCYGHRKAKEIVSNTETGTQPGATTTVNYTYTLTGVPQWAQAAEVGNAFPQLKAELSGPAVAQTTLVLGQDGWHVPANAPQTNSTNPTTNPDGKVVE